jgi:predicted transcriptional regulator
MKLTVTDIGRLINIYQEGFVRRNIYFQELVEKGLVNVTKIGDDVYNYSTTDKGKKHIENLCNLDIQLGNDDKLTNAEVLKKLMLNEYRQRWDELSRGIVYPGAKVTYETLINNLEQGKTKLPGEVRGRYADYLKLNFIEGWYSTVKVNGADELLVIVRLETELFLRMNTSKWGTKEFTTMKFMPYSDMKPIKLEEL